MNWAAVYACITREEQHFVSLGVKEGNRTERIIVFSTFQTASFFRLVGSVI